MSSLESRIEADLHAAMSARDVARVSALRMLKSSVKYAAIEKKTAALSDADVRQVIQKQIRQRRESIDQFTKAGRAELAAAETREAGILESYLS